MNRKLFVSALVVSTLVATGCEKKRAVPAPALPGAFVQSRLVSAKTVAGSPQRFIAERDEIDVVTPDAKLQKAWESTVAFCATIQCQVISSSITTRTGNAAPSGNVSMRVAPEDVQKLVGCIKQLGKIVQHNTEREDETASVVDTEAKIKNLTAFRDNLRAMLAKPNLTVGNLVEINKQLTDTQADLDSQTAQRKILASETEKTAVDISFSARSSGSTGVLADLWNALLDAGATLVGSVATLVTVVIFLIPWAIVLLLIVWLVTKIRRRSRQRRTP